MKFKALVSAAFLAASVPALAQFAPGTKISDTAGGAVGTVVSATGGNVVVKTDKHEVALPETSFTKTDTGYIIAMTQADLNAAVDKSLADAQALVAIGAVVKDTAGGTVGTIEALDDQYATVKLTNSSVKIPRSAVAATPQGPVIGMTAAQLEAQSAAAAPEATPAAE